MTSDPDRTATTMQGQGRALRALARSILGSTDGADDVVQDAYAAAMERPPQDGARPGWLATVVRNLARRAVRDRGRRRSHESAGARAGSAPATDDVVADVEMHRDLADAVLALAEPYRTAVVLRFWHDLPPRAISRRLGVPVDTVKTHLQRGLAMLRARLDRRYGDRRAWLLALVPIARPKPIATLSAGTAVSLSAVVLTMNVKHVLAAAAGVLLLSSLAFWALSGPGISTAPVRPDVDPPARAAGVGGESPDAESDATTIEAPDRAATARTEVSDDRPPCAVTGLVVADATGTPIAGATVRLVNLYSYEQYPDRSTDTDEHGRFRLDSPWWGEGDWVAYRFALASAPGLATRELRIDWVVQERIADGALDLGTFRLVRGVGVTGRVLESDGQPLRGSARLLLWDPSRRGSFVSMYGGRTVGSTDDGGRFALTERLTPPEGGELMLAAVAGSGIGWARLGITPGQQHLDSIEIRLQPSGGLAVRVVDGDGEPIAGATVCVTPHFLPIGLAPSWQPTWAEQPPNVPELTALFRRETDADGRAVLSDLPLPAGQRVRDANRQQRPGRDYIATARAEGYVQNLATGKPAPDGLAEVEITLLAKREVLVRGRVLTPDGAPVVGITVRGNGTPVSAVTDDEGRYGMEPFAYGKSAYFITEGPDIPRVISQLEMPQEGDTVQHDIVVEPRAPVTGRVVDQRGDPVAGVELLLGVEGGIHYQSTPEVTGGDGLFAFPDATARHDHLWITPPEPRAAWEPVHNRKLSRRSGEEIVLRRFAGALVDLHVAVVDGDTGRPAPPSEASLRPLLGDGWAVAQVQPRPELALGQVTAEDIRPGRYRLIVRTTDGRRGVRVLEVGDDPIAEVRMELWQPATVVCALDPSALTDTERASTRAILVVLRPQHEQSYAIDERGKSLPYTPNTGIFRLGKTESFRLARVTPNTPVCLRVIGNEFFAESWFTAKPGGETHVTLRPERQGTLEFRVPADLPAGTIEIDVAGADDVWHPVLHTTMPAEGAGTVKLARGPGTVRWRLRIWAENEVEPTVRTGTHAVVAGATTEVAWPSK